MEQVLGKLFEARWSPNARKYSCQTFVMAQVNLTGVQVPYSLNSHYSMFMTKEFFIIWVYMYFEIKILSLIVPVSDNSG